MLIRVKINNNNLSNIEKFSDITNLTYYHDKIFFRGSVGSGNLIQHVYSYNNIVNSEYASNDKLNCLDEAYKYSAKLRITTAFANRLGVFNVEGTKVFNILIVIHPPFF